MERDPLEHKDVQQLRALAREQKAALATYKETLSRIYAEFDARVEELSLIRRVSDVLRQAQDLSGLASGLVEVVIGELPADFVCLVLTDPEMTTLCPAALMDRDWEAARAFARTRDSQCVPLGVGPMGAAVAQGRILILPALTEGLPRPWPPDLPRDARSLLVMPLVSRQQILGAMLLISRTPEAPA